MAKTSIICGKRAGSHEHVFPAALGGRRTNKGVYCGPHNKGFSGLASAINAQLKPINALLAVRPDHKDKAEPMSTRRSRATASLFSIATLLARRQTPRLGTKNCPSNSCLVGAAGLEAIAYIALTFFTHYFQDHARKLGVQPIKDFLHSHGTNDFAWWESDAALASLPSNEFEFGHTIAVMTTAKGEATALVSLFGSLNFGVALGNVEGISNATVVTFIDPLADSPPDDFFRRVQCALSRVFRASTAYS